MKLVLQHNRPEVETLTAVIARSQIVMAGRARRLPAGYGDVDAAILDWIVNESRRACHGYSRVPS